MFRYIDQYISTYNSCLQTKPIHYLSLKELYLLFVLNIRWETISIDFVVKVSKFVKFDMMMIVVNSVSKKAYFILTYSTITI